MFGFHGVVCFEIFENVSIENDDKDSDVSAVRKNFVWIQSYSSVMERTQGGSVRIL